MVLQKTLPVVLWDAQPRITASRLIKRIVIMVLALTKWKESYLLKYDPGEFTGRF
jgi:hypothetical protein